jgi:hypothetical protein
MPNTWVSLRSDQLIPVNKVVNDKEQLEKGLEEEEEKNDGVGIAAFIFRCFVLRLIDYEKEAITKTDALHWR